MDFSEFERTILFLCEKGDFDRAEKEKCNAFPHIRDLLRSKNKEAHDYLKLLSDLAGEAESFENLSRLLAALVSEGLIDGAYANELVNASPAHRWL